jgi:hypothetical protein
MTAFTQNALEIKAHFVGIMNPMQISIRRKTNERSNQSSRRQPLSGGLCLSAMWEERFA